MPRCRGSTFPSKWSLNDGEIRHIILDTILVVYLGHEIFHPMLVRWKQVCFSPNQVLGNVLSSQIDRNLSQKKILQHSIVARVDHLYNRRCRVSEVLVF